MKMKINKIMIDSSIIDEQKEKYNIIIPSIGSNQDNENVRLFGDIILPDDFDKHLILKVILYDKDNEIIGTEKYEGIGDGEEKFLTFLFHFHKYENEFVTKAKFFFVEENRDLYG